MLLTRRTQIVVLLAALFASVTPAVNAQTVTVTVNGSPVFLNPGPIERSGRVFVPLRGIFERLGAGVVYNAGVINATKGSTTVSLRIGSTQATINGQPQILDVAPFIVGASTYVPLRFIAQSLGATVNYESSTRTVAIVAAAPAPPPPPPHPPVPPPNPPPVSIVNLRVREPSPDSFVDDRFVRISAEFTHRVNPGSVRVFLNGNNVTGRTDVSSTGFSYRPPAPLDFGSNNVRVSGRDVSGSGFDRSWSFNVRRSGPAPSPIFIDISTPNDRATVGREFVIRGTTVRAARVTVTAGQGSHATGQFNGSTTADARGNFSIQVTVTAPPGQNSVRVRITARDPFSQRTADRVLQLQLIRLTR